MNSQNRSDILNKVLYLHGRPMAHPMHASLARSIGSDFYPVDKYMRWQDKKKGVVYRFMSWVANAVIYPVKGYNFLLVDNLHLSPVIAKKIGLLGKRKIIVHLGSHTLYFMYAGKFAPLVYKLHQYALQNYDVLFCEGKMEAELAKKILGKKIPKTYITYLGVPTERCVKLNSVLPKLNSASIIIIANGPTAFREWYKGLDLMIKAYALCFSYIKNLTLTILGEWEDAIIRELTRNLDNLITDTISFAGAVNNIDDHLSESSLCLHCTRGDAFPTSTLEAMSAGVVPIVSEWTGTKEVIRNVSLNLIVPLDENEMASRIIWYFSLPESEKRELSNKCRKVVEDYTEEMAINHYQKTFDKMKKDLLV